MTPPPDPGAPATPEARRILHVTAPAHFGGLESVVIALATGQRRRGHDVTVAAFLGVGEGADHPFLEALESGGVRVARIETPGRAYLQEVRALRSLAVETDAGVLHTHGPHTDVIGRWVARAAGNPTVTTVHGFTGGDWKWRVVERLQLRVFRRFDAVVAVSPPLGDRLRSRGVPEERLHLIPNAWRPAPPSLTAPEARARLGVPPATLHLGWIGRLSREKGPDLLLEALARISDLPWVASIVGDGPLRGELAARCEALGMEERVRWLGNVPKAGDLIPGFDLHLLTSRTEGTPIVLLEAMAAGVPIVATPVGGVPHLVGTAALLATGDPVEGLAAAVRLLHSEPKRARRLGRLGSERLREVADEDRWLDAYERIYEQVAARGRNSR